MIKAVLELSQYIMAFNAIIYMLLSYRIFAYDDKDKKNAIYVLQLTLIFLNHLIGYLVIISNVRDVNYLFFFAFQVLFLFAYVVLSRTIYEGINKQLLNHICMFLSISFVILSRISYDKGFKQFKIIIISLVIATIIPWIMKYIRYLKRGTWVYAGTGIGLLLLVLLMGNLTNGSKLSFQFLGFSIQPSEFIKILFVFAIAGLLWEAKDFGQILLSGVVAAIHICILVASKDLGSALIFFVVYIIMLYVATCQILYLIAGTLMGGVAAYAGYQLFTHVQVRVANWINPWNDLDGTGYQITQSLFAIGTGKWFGMGLAGGNPSSIPYVEQDFIFSAICEEYGTVFGICLILLCVSTFLLCLNLAKQCRDRYMKLIVCGLSCVYIFQVLLTIGGDTKFIPLTGVTLPLISYGGSSVLSSLMLFSVIQGIYMQKYYIIDTIPIPKIHRTSDKKLLQRMEKERQKRIDFINATRQIKVVSYIFPVIFAGLIFYLIYFVHVTSDTVINNSYNNKRQEILASETYRGDIVTEKGDVLATTQVSADGTETRVYPYGNLFAHAVGYSTNGRMGVEQMMNINLVTSNDNLVEKIQNDLQEEKHKGNTVVTTFEPKLQDVAYQALGAYNGAVIVMEPSTGKILAMVSKPDFDPNQIDEIWDNLVNDENSSVLLNRATQGLYPPGSTFKIITALEYIKENRDDIDSYQFQCNGSFRSDTSKINCYHGSKHGNVDFYTSFAKSCNSSFANMSLQLDKDKFESTLSDLLFYKDLPVDFPYKKSQAQMGSDVEDGEIIQTAIGQGKTQMTPLHLSMITSAIANNGLLMKPYCITQVQASTGKVILSNKPQEYGNLMTEEDAAVLTEMMAMVVENGTATKLSGRKYTAAGKTGSAEYNTKSDSHAWFTGFAPVENPQIAVTVIVEGAGSGGDYAVPIARRIMDEYFE